jgi:threonine dehydratase
VAVLSGANMNFDRLRFVAERAELGEAREALLAIILPERPGAFASCARCSAGASSPSSTTVEQPRDRAHLHGRLHRVEAGRRSAGAAAERGRLPDRRISPTTRWRSCTCATWWAATRPTCATSGCAGSSSPERPGALTQFLEKLGGRWNVSLFHSATMGRLRRVLRGPSR